MTAPIRILILAAACAAAVLGGLSGFKKQRAMGRHGPPHGHWHDCGRGAVWLFAARQFIAATPVLILVLAVVILGPIPWAAFLALVGLEVAALGTLVRLRARTIRRSR